MESILAATYSLCPECLTRIPARRIVEDGNVYLAKSCERHGDFKTLIWRDAQLYQEWGAGGISSKLIKKRLSKFEKGCPYDCGLCPNHQGEACTVLMEVSGRCDIECPVCFANANKSPGRDPTVNEIREMYHAVLEASGPCPIQLSGGEPTVRDDLPDIIVLGKDMGFEHIQINTNGLRIAREPEYLQELKKAGADLVYLQFDGLSEQVYRHIRGANLLDVKLQAVENCSALKIGVILVPTLIPKVNDHQMGEIIQFAKRHIPVVKGVHFQPVSFFGRYPRSPCDEDRITIPDVLKLLEIQTAQEIKLTDFVPRRRKDSHCGFSAFYVLTEEGKLQATTNFQSRQSPVLGSGCLKESPAEHVRRFISQRLKFVNGGNQERPAQPSFWQSFFRRAETHFLSISGMPFQDAWTVDLERLQGCCIQVVTPNKKLIPFCAFYLTSVGGERLDHVSRGVDSQ